MRGKDPLDEIFVDSHKEKTILEELKYEIDKQEAKIYDLNKEFSNAKLLEKTIYEEYKKIKLRRGRLYREWHNARKDLKKMKTRLSGKPSQIRRWGKENLGKILNNMFGE